ncbi:MAG: WYL domain-containing protein, partial [Clostridia bacterium]|nr:WYL domain-containing protein [Clostridia bacterium]
MNGESKKNLLLHILDILQKYSDEDHRLSQKNIIERLEKEYDTEVERKGIRPNIEKLINAGYSIEYDEKIRHTKGEENTVWTNFYLCRDFTDSELRFLIDSLLCFSHLPNSQCRELIEKLEGLSSVYFKSKMKHTSVFNDDSGGNKELFYTIEILAEA